MDAARILRVPETQNCKYDPPRNVKLLRVSDFDFLINRVTDPLEPYKVPHANAQKPAENDLSAGIGVFAPMDIARVIPNCPHLQESLRTHGANLTGQPIWAMNALLSTFTIQGRALLHLLSRDNSYYNRENTDELYDRKERDGKQRTSDGPPVPRLKEREARHVRPVHIAQKIKARCILQNHRAK